MTQITQIYNLQSSFTTHDYISKTCIAMVWLAGSGYVMSKNEKKGVHKSGVYIWLSYSQAFGNCLSLRPKIKIKAIKTKF